MDKDLKETTPVRVSKRFKEFVISLISKKGIENFSDAADEIVASYKFFKKEDILLWKIYEENYIKNKKNIPLLVYETLTCLSNYIGITQKEITRFDLMQIDRWNIVVYYLLSRAYLQLLRPESFREKEQKALAESEVCARYLFSSKYDKFVKVTDAIIKELDAYKYASPSSRTWLLAVCMENEDLNVLMYDQDVLFREKKLQNVLHECLIDASFTHYSSIFSNSQSYGILNKIIKILE